MSNHKNILDSMGIDLDTKRFELKLRAIAKHAKALADELDAIDNTCDDCGGPITTREATVGTCRECERCQIGECIPTRLEGSE